MPDNFSIDSVIVTIFVIVDGGSSMYGENTEAFNNACKSVISKIKYLNLDAIIRIAVLQYGITPVWWLLPTDIKECRWKTVLSSYGPKWMGLAFEELDRELYKFSEGQFNNLILLISNGYSVDDPKPALAKLKNNKWFNKAVRYAISIDDRGDPLLLSDFTGDTKSLMITKSSEILKQTIEATILSFINNQSSYG